MASPPILPAHPDPHGLPPRNPATRSTSAGYRPGSGLHDAAAHPRAHSGAFDIGGGDTHQGGGAMGKAVAERTRSRTIGGALDSLIRAQRLQTGGMVAVAERVTDLLIQEPLPTLSIAATLLTVDNEVALQADDNQGRWLLPAFMAGLRVVKPTEDSRPVDTQALAAALAGLKLTPDALVQFADWLWSDGLDGYEIELHSGFTEILEVAEDPHRAKQAISLLRSEMAQSLAQQTMVAVRDLDQAALLPEFQAPLDTFTQAARSGQLGLSLNDADRLRLGCDSAAFWTRQELMMVLSHPKLRAATSPTAIARNLVRVAAEAFDQEFLPLVSVLSQHTDEFARAVLAALEKEPVGATIAERVQLDDASLQRLCGLLQGSSAKLAAGLVMGLCERAARDPQARVATTKMAQQVGVEFFAAKITPETLTKYGRMGATAVLLSAQAPMPMVVSIVRTMPAAEGLTLVPALPPAVLNLLSLPYGLWLGSASPQERTQLLTLGLQKAAASLTPVAVRTFVAQGGEGWELPTVRLLARTAIVQHCASELLTMYRSGRTNTEVRLVLLETLAQSADYGTDVLTWRLAELVEHDAIRLRLAELRQEKKR